MQNSITEYKVLSSLFDPKNDEIIYKLRDEWFTDNRKDILLAMRECFTTYGYISPEGVEQFYKDLPGEIFIDGFYQIEPMIDELKKLSRKRRFHEAGKKLLEESEKDNPTGFDVEIDLADVDFDTSLVLAGTQLLGEMARKRSGEYIYLDSGFEFLNAMMGGEWERRAVSLIIADPGVGKTAFAADSMLRMGRKNRPSLLIELEMSKASLLSRMASNAGDLDSESIRSGTLTEDELEHYHATINTINKMPIYVIDNPSMTIHDISAIIHQYVKKGVEVFFIDHLQIITLRTDDRHKELGEIAKKLKNLAKRYNIHICLLSQKQNAKDGVWQVRDSGDVPANVDIIINMSVEGGNDDIKNITIDFVKNRNGRTGKCPHLYIGEYLRFQ